MDKTPKEFYDEKLSDRSPYEDRAEEFAELTIPALFRRDGSLGSDEYKKLYVQSFLSKLVKGLVSKITLTMFPPSTSAFKLSPDSGALEEITGGDEDIRAELFNQFSLVAERINKEIELQNIRKDAFSAIEQQIVIGSCIVEKVKNKGIKVHTLRNIAVSLDDAGEAYEICVREVLTKIPSTINYDDKDDKDEYELYTMAYFDEDSNRWVMSQQFEDEIIEQDVKYSVEKFPFEYLGMVWNPGEKYHRPFVEDYYGSMNSYQKLTKVLTEGAVIASKSLVFVNEIGGRTRRRDVVNAKNGDVIIGHAEDVSSFQHNKNFDFQVPMQVRAEIRQELEDAFLARNAITRDAERVTAEEIRQMSQELETSLSAVYAQMSDKFIKRVVVWIIDELNIRLDATDIEIITGLNALGKGNEINQLDGFITRLAQLGLQGYIKERELATRYANGYGINTEALIKTPKEVAQERKQQMEAEAEQELLQSGAKAAGEEAVRGGM